MTINTCKVDMHVHSRYSHRPSSWILKKIGCAECYTEPLDAYQLLKNRGMGLVTLTDHNTIDGCLEIAHLPDTFISEEVTTYFPEDKCKLHVLVYNITEKQHEDISRFRNNVFDLVDFLNIEKIVHAIAHPMYSVNGLLQAHHLEQLFLLFQNWELNGARDSLQNQIVARIINGLTEETITRLADFYDINACVSRLWDKCLISGSDDHSSLYLGRSYTEVAGASSVETFLSGIRQRRNTVKTHDATPETLAHNIYSIMYQFYNDEFQVNRWINDTDLTNFFRDTLLTKSFTPAATTKPRPESRGGLSAFSGEFAGSSLPDQILEKAKKAIFAAPSLSADGAGPDHSPADLDDIWMRFVNRLSEMIMRQFADDLLSRLTNADLFYLFNTIGSSASLYMMLSPYFISYSLFSRDRAFSIDCLQKHEGKPVNVNLPDRHIATFTDTFNEINGVATAIQSQVEAARLTGKALTLITCDPGQQSTSNIEAFTPIGEFDLPEYPELKVYYPPLLKILSYCYRRQFTHIHAETPGAMGLTALAVARILNLPFHGTYHTSLPQTVSALTGDSQIEDMFWKYVIWFYGQMETIYAPSAMTARELVERGLPEEKIIVHQWGVNTASFHPNKRNGYFKANHQLKDTDTKLLYVGRVSQEKNLTVLEDMIKRISQIRDDVHLIVVGDGPYLPEMRAALDNYPAIFTGYLTGEDLAQAYASSDIFVFPSTVDTMGNVVVEAQASGVPVLVTDQGGPRENMIDQRTGRVLPADDDLTNHFVNAVLELCDDPGTWSTMRDKARAYTLDRSFENSFLKFWNSYGCSSIC